MSQVETCISCATVSGSFVPPGGVVFENQYWVVALRANPIRFPCLPLLILKRHCEDMAELSKDESASLGQLIQLTSQVLNKTLHPAKVHFGIYAEGVKHIHVHVFPRMPNMPVGNIPNLWLNQWFDFLSIIGLKKSYSNEVVARNANEMREAYLELKVI